MDLTPATATGMNPIPAVRGAFTGNHAVVCTGLVRSVVQHSKHRPCFVRGVGVERLRLDSAIRKSSIQYTRLHSVSLILRLQSDEAAIQAFCGGSRKTRASLEADLSLSLALNTEMSQVALIDNVFGLPASFLARGAYLCFFFFFFGFTAAVLWADNFQNTLVFTKNEVGPYNILGKQRFILNGV